MSGNWARMRGHNADMDIIEESHSSTVPRKPAKEGRVPRPEQMAEGRGLTKENTKQTLLDGHRAGRGTGNGLSPGPAACRVLIAHHSALSGEEQ